MLTRWDRRRFLRGNQLTNRLCCKFWGFRAKLILHKSIKRNIDYSTYFNIIINKSCWIYESFNRGKINTYYDYSTHNNMLAPHKVINKIYMLVDFQLLCSSMWRTSQFQYELSQWYDVVLKYRSHKQTEHTFLWLYWWGKLLVQIRYEFKQNQTFLFVRAMEPVLNDESVNTTVTKSHLNQSSRLLLIFSELSKEVTSLTEK